MDLGAAADLLETGIPLDPSEASVGDRPVFRSDSIFRIGRPADHPGSALGDFFQTPEDHSP